MWKLFDLKSYYRNISTEFEDEEEDEEEEDEDEDMVKDGLRYTYNSTLSTTNLNIMDTDFFKETEMPRLNSRDEFKFDFMSNVCICMIDIVGFSSWCSNHLPNIIAGAMINYNNWIGSHVERYNCVNKIELVGDCCMLVAGKVNDTNEILTDCYLSMIRMAVDLLEDIISLRNIFKSSIISIRIGIHVSDVIGIYLEKPHRYQMFGNDINICSRLESSCIPNTIHVSEKTLMCVQNICKTSCGPCSRTIRGKAIRQNYKGVGNKTSYQLFLRKPDIFLMNMNHLFTNKIMRMFPSDIFKNHESKIESISDCQSYFFKMIILNISSERGLWDSIDDVVAMLANEDQFKKTVCLITNNEDYEKVYLKYRYDFYYILSYEDPDFFDDLKKSIEKPTEIQEQTNRGSLDLTIF
jgi:class 3 adenylate cyclase